MGGSIRKGSNGGVRIMGSKKIKNEIVVTFCGNQSEEVTGSANTTPVVGQTNLNKTNIKL